MDVGTISSFHETSMSLLEEKPVFDLYDYDFPIFSNENLSSPEYIGPQANVSGSIVGNGSQILGDVIHSVISVDSYVGRGARVKDSVLLPGATVEDGATVTPAPYSAAKIRRRTSP